MVSSPAPKYSDWFFSICVFVASSNNTFGYFFQSCPLTPNWKLPNEQPMIIL